MSAPETSLEALTNRYTYHAPKGDQAARYERVRGCCLELAQMLATYCPQSRELSRALNALDEVMFLANAAIARNE